jgi:hypothetical protein
MDVDDIAPKPVQASYVHENQPGRLKNGKFEPYTKEMAAAMYDYYKAYFESSGFQSQRGEKRSHE